MAFSVVMSGLFAWFALHIAQTYHKSINLKIIPYFLEISLSASEAVYIYWLGLFLFSVIFLMSLYGLCMAFTSKAQLTLTSDEICIPVGSFYFSKGQVIPLSEIISLELKHNSFNRILKIVHQRGQTYLSHILLPDKYIFDEIVDILKDKIKDH